EVTECGCFGDAIPMTAWQSFAKNIVLSTMILILFFQKKHIRPMLVKTGENVAVVIFALFSLGFPLYTYNYLPVLDFRPYKVGTNIIESTKGTPDVLKYFYTLKNKKTGETKEFDAWPKNWDTEWDYIGNHTKIVKKGIQAAILDFSISNVDGKDITDSILANPNYNFLLIEYDLAKSNLGTQNKINELANSCDKNHIKFAALTGSDNDQIKNFRHQENTMYPFYVTDGTDLKTMIRSNPGLILMKNGVIIAKWHFHSIPTFNKFNEKYLKGQ
ncbi:MAG TPA: BT_3928 family protein, partial [Bacteroidia bacterium]|nr:BT_3928 family protein [Bacteroidia bacterium]